MVELAEIRRRGVVELAGVEVVRFPARRAGRVVAERVRGDRRGYAGLSSCARGGGRAGCGRAGWLKLSRAGTG